MRTQSITLKLTPTEYLAIEAIMESRAYDSRSALLRAGLGFVFDRHKLDKSFDQAIERERTVHKPRPSTARRYFSKDIAVPDPDEILVDVGLLPKKKKVAVAKRRKKGIGTDL